MLGATEGVGEGTAAGGGGEAAVLSLSSVATDGPGI